MQAYLRTDSQLHALCQLIAKANRSYVPRQSDDSHTNLSFDPLSGRILGRWIEAGRQRCLLSLHLESLAFQWLDERLDLLQEIPAAGRLIGATEAALDAGLAGLGLPPAGFREQLHFEIPAYDFLAVPFAPADPEGLAIWSHWRSIALQACAALLNHLQAPGEARIWPHHFDTGIYIEAAGQMGIGFGFAMADSLSSSPYFYLAGYPRAGSLRFEGLPVLEAGRWQTGSGWQGALLPASELEALPWAQRLASVQQFAHRALAWHLHAA